MAQRLRMWKDSPKCDEANGWDMLAIEGESAPRFAVYVCNLDDEPCQRVADRWGCKETSHQVGHR